MFSVLVADVVMLDFEFNASLEMGSILAGYYPEITFYQDMKPAGQNVVLSSRAGQWPLTQLVALSTALPNSKIFNEDFFRLNKHTP